VRMCNRPGCKEPACEQSGSNLIGRLCRSHAAARRAKSAKDKSYPKCPKCGGVAQKGERYCRRHASKAMPWGQVDSITFDEFRDFELHEYQKVMLDEMVKQLKQIAPLEVRRLAARWRIPVNMLEGRPVEGPQRVRVWFDAQYGAPGRWASCTVDRHGVWRSASGMYMPQPRNICIPDLSLSTSQ